MDTQWDQTMDHQRLDIRRRDRMGAGQRGNRRLPGGKGRARIHHQGYPRQVLDARVDYVRIDPRRRAYSRQRATARGQGAARATKLLDASALWHRMGRDWCREELL